MQYKIFNTVSDIPAGEFSFSRKMGVGCWDWDICLLLNNNKLERLVGFK